MSNATSSTEPKLEGTPSSENSLSSNSLASEVVSLQKFLSSPPADADGASNLSSLLQHLDVANGMAQSVENKLDNLLENLEGLLEGLEGTDGISAAVAAEARGGRMTPESSKPQLESTDVKDAG